MDWRAPACNHSTLFAFERFRRRAARPMVVIAPSEPPPLPDAARAIAGALARPLGHPSLDRFLEPGDRVVVVAPSGAEDVATAVEAVLDAACRAKVASVALLSRPDERAPSAQLEPASFGPVRVHRAFAEADRVVAVSPIGFDPVFGFQGGATALLRVAAAPSTRDRTSTPAQLRELLDRLGPVFSVEVAFQRGGRPSAVFAGEPGPAHRAAAAYWGRWRSLDVGEGFDGVVADATGFGSRDTATALLMAERALRPGGVLALVGARPDLDALEAPLARGTACVLARREVLFASSVEEAAEALRGRLPGRSLAHLPDPLRTLPLRGGSRLPSAP